MGIPFDPQFNEDIYPESVFQKLGLEPNVTTILIMGGGQGLGPIKTIVRSLEKIKPGLQEIVICGINSKLYRSLKRKIKKYKKKILLFKYLDNVHELMGISDIIITKPGGITTAEALAKKLAMIIVKPIPGQEVSNTDYLTQKGAAIKIGKPKDVGRAVEELLNHPAKLKQLRESAGFISKPNASLDIAKLILNV